MNLAELRAAVQRSLPSDAADSIDQYLNWAQSDLLNRTKWSFTERTVGDADVAIAEELNGVYQIAGPNALIEDFSGLIDLGIAIDSGIKHKLIALSPQDFDLLTYGRVATGDPAVYTVVGGIATPSVQTDFDTANSNLLFTAKLPGGEAVSIEFIDPGSAGSASVSTVGNVIEITLAYVAAVQATYATALTGANNDLDFSATSHYVGAAGNAITIRYVDPGIGDQALAVTVDNTDITVHLATDGGSAITSTAALVHTAVLANADAAELVTIANHSGNDGTGVVTALSVHNLAGGVDGHTSTTATQIIALVVGNGGANALVLATDVSGSSGAGRVSAFGPVNLSGAGAVTNVLVWPTPDDDGFLIPRFYRNTDSVSMVDDDDEPIVPVFLHQALVQLATATGLMAFDQENEAGMVQGKAEALIAKALASDIAMRGGDSTTYKLQPIMPHNPNDPREINPAGGDAQA